MCENCARKGTCKKAAANEGCRNFKEGGTATPNLVTPERFALRKGGIIRYVETADLSRYNGVEEVIRRRVPVVYYGAMKVSYRASAVPGTTAAFCELEDGEHLSPEWEGTILSDELTEKLDPMAYAAEAF